MKRVPVKIVLPEVVAAAVIAEVAAVAAAAVDIGVVAAVAAESAAAAIADSSGSLVVGSFRVRRGADGEFAFKQTCLDSESRLDPGYA